MAQTAIKHEEADSRQTSDKQHLKQRSILIIDDEHGIRNFLIKGLSRHVGFIEAAEDINKAEELRQRCHFDLIIADIRLPGKSGVEWVADLREAGFMTPVIFITAHSHLDVAIDALRVGASDFIIKPFRIDQIQAAVERCIERQEIHRENYVLKRQVDKIYEGLPDSLQAVTSYQAPGGRADAEPV